MKKNLLLFFLLFVVGTMSSFAEEWTDSDGNTWSFNITDNENHYVELTGLVSGENATVPGSVKVGEIEYAVNRIGGWAFYNNSSITSVGNLSACTSIGDIAFRGCSSLTSIGDLSACTSIGGSAFYDCSSLTSIGDLSACTSIGGHAFYGCSSLTSIGDLPACTRIEGYAFYGCSSLTSIGDLPACTRIEGYAFWNCSSLTSIGDLSACISIGGSAFYGCSSLTNIGDLPACTSIEGYAFRYCSSLTSIDLSACTSIEGGAFSGCSSLTSIGDLSACTSIGGGAFYGCSSLTSIGDLSACTSIGGDAFAGCSSLTSIGDLSACTSIGGDAFWDCSNLSSIGDLSACTSIGGSAFSGCSSLTGIGDLPACTSIGGSAFNGCSSLNSIGDLSACTSIGGGAFAGCSSLTSIGDLSACTSIGGYAFSGCSSLTSIGDMSACTSIGGYAFSGCAFTEVSIGSGVTLDNANAFPEYMTILVPDADVATYRAADIWSDLAVRIISKDAQRHWDITITETPATGSAVQNAIGESNLGNVTTLKITGNINSYDFFVMRNNMPNLHVIDLSDANIVASDYKYYSSYHTEDNIFPQYGFYQQKKLTQIKFPKSITAIGESALKECENMFKIEMYPGIVTVGWQCFTRCSYVSELIFPEGVEVIDGVCYDWIWPSMINLRRVVLPSTLKRIGNNSFYHGCRNLEEINFPSSLEYIGGGAFYGTKLKEITLPSSLTYIGGEAFTDCENLKTVRATAIDPYSIQLSDNSFDNYSNKTIYLPIDEESGWDATYNAYYWHTQWGQFNTKLAWTPTYDKVSVNSDYNQNNGTIPGADINGQIGTNGGYIVGENASQELGNVTVEQDDEKGGSIIGEGNGNLSIENLLCNIKITPNKWYFFCFPFDVDWTELDYADASYIWHKYDGSERAQGNGGWKKLQGNVDGDNILHAGEGYIFQANHPFTLTIQCQNPDMAAIDKAKELTTYVSSNPENASWNLIGNPFFSYFNMDEMGNTGNTEQYSAPVTVYDGNNYQALRPGDDDYQFHPFQAFFVQKPEGESQLTFGSEGRETYTQSVEVQSNARALRAMARKNPDRQIINLTISDGENSDKTRVVFNEAKSMAYEAECDACKFFTSEAIPQIYTISNGVSYSINERPSAEGSVELGMRISKEGNYTIEAARMDTPMLLTDHETGITTDLSESAYSFIAKAGTYAKRFTMVKANDTTAIEGIEEYSDNGALYDLNGRKMSASQRGIMVKANKKVLMK